MQVGIIGGYRCFDKILRDLIPWLRNFGMKLLRSVGDTDATFSQDFRVGISIFRTDRIPRAASATKIIAGAPLLLSIGLSATAVPH